MLYKVTRGNSVGAIPWFLRNSLEYRNYPVIYAIYTGYCVINAIERGYSVKNSLFRGYSRKTEQYLYSGSIPWIFKIPLMSWKRGNCVYGIAPWGYNSLFTYFWYSIGILPCWRLFWLFKGNVELLTLTKIMPLKTFLRFEMMSSWKILYTSVSETPMQMQQLSWQ